MKLTFRANYDCDDGHSILVVGSAPQIGNWDVKSALVLEHKGQICEATIEVDGAEKVEYKFVLSNIITKKVQWEEGPNRVVEPLKADAVVETVPFHAGKGDVTEADLPATLLNAEKMVIGNGMNGPFKSTMKKPWWMFWQSDEDYEKEVLERINKIATGQPVDAETANGVKEVMKEANGTTN